MKKVGIVFLALLCTALVCGGFFLLKSKIRVHPDEGADLTAVEKIITRNLDENYPSTPREVVKFYNKIILNYYKEDYTEDQFDGMMTQARKLLDDKLLENNPSDSYKEAVKKEIANYKSRDREIRQSAVCDSGDVLYTKDKENGDDLAYVTATYFVKEKKEFTRTYQMYVLRKNDEGQWKILTYYQIDKDPNMEDETN